MRSKPTTQVETITITDMRVTAVLPRLPKLPPAVLARLQADMARRIEAMAYKAMMGSVPVREQTTLRLDSSGRLIPDGNTPRRSPYWGGVINMDATA